MSDSKIVHVPPPQNGAPYGDIVPRNYFEAPPGNSPVADEDDEGILSLLRVLQRHKAVLLLAGTLGIIAGVLVTFPETPVYEATVSIEIQGLNTDFLNMRNLTPTTMQSWDPSYEIQTQIREMQSRPLMDRVQKKMAAIDRNALRMDPDRTSAWRKLFHLSERASVSVEEATFSTGVRIKPSLTSRIVEISCDSTNPKVAAQFANTVAEEYIAFNQESRFEASRNTGEWLNRQLQDLKIKLEKSEDELQNYATNANLMFLNTGDGGEKGGGTRENVTEERLRQLQSETLKAQADRVDKQSHYESVKNASDEELEALDDPTLGSYQSRLSELRRSLAELDVALMPANPKVAKVQAQIDTTVAELKKARKTVLSRMANQYQAAVKREALLNEQLVEQRRVVSQQAEKVIHYNILKREVDTNRSVYDAMLQRVREAGVVAAIKADSIRIVDPAVPPGAPYKPNLQRSAFLGLIGGLLLGVGLVIVRDRANRNLQQPGDSAFYLNIPELGVIPTAAADAGKRDRREKPTEELLIRPDLDPVELITWNRKFSLVAEAFRTTLTSVLFSGHHGDQPRLIVLTSANPSEGKTTVTINLAITMAEINRRVLLIDADMRRPRVQNLFNLGPGPGLADLLREKDPRDRALMEQSICQTGIPGLFVMRSGRNSGVVSNLLHSARLPELLHELRNDFDTVVIDTPPALQISDARVIGRLADAVLLVVRAGQTTRDEAKMVKQRFHEDGTLLLGTILNGWDPKQDIYGYKYRYYGNNYRAPFADEEAE